MRIKKIRHTELSLKFRWESNLYPCQSVVKSLGMLGWAFVAGVLNRFLLCRRIPSRQDIRMCSRPSEGCSHGNTCNSARSSCHENRGGCCDGSTPTFTVMTLPMAQDKNPLTQTQCPMVYSTPQLQQAQQLKQPVPYPPQQQMKQPPQMMKK